MRDRSKEYPLNGEQDSLLAGKEKNVTEIVRMGKLTKPSEVDSLNMKISSKDGNELIVISAQEYQRIIKETKTYKVVTTLDVLFASFFIAPCVVGYWRGTWILIDKNPQYFPIWATLLFSTILNIGLTILRGRFTYYSTKFQNETNWKLLPKIGMLVYSYVSTVSSIITWRALWAIVDHYTGVQYIKGDRVSVETSQQVLIVGLVCLLGTIAMKCCKTGLGVPFCIAVDTIENTFEFPTRYKIEMGEKTSLYILDCLFSVIIVGTLVVFVWRGGWVLMDIFIFPENEVHSAWGSLLVGYAIVAVAFLMQPAMRMLCDRLKGALRLFAADVFLIFSLVGTINVWRGIWNLLNIYLLPDNLALSCWLTHWTCWILLVLLGCSNSLLVRGVYIDAEEPAGKCVVFPCYYLRIIFQEERIKKLNTIQLEATAKRKQDNTKPTSEILENNHIVNINTISDRIQTDINHKPAV